MQNIDYIKKDNKVDNTAIHMVETTGMDKEAKIERVIKTILTMHT